MKKNNKTIVFDIDGVLADFEGSFCYIFGEERRNLTDLTQRYPEKAFEISEFINSIDTYVDLSPIFGGWALTNQVRDHGYKVVLLTSRPYWVREVTEEWLQKYNFIYDALYFTQDKAKAIEIMNSSNKFQVVALIDDLPRNIANLPKGVFGSLWEQPWNEGYYPKVRYALSSMRTEMKFDTGSEWVDFWKGK